MVGVLRIELSTRSYQDRVLPLNYTPSKNIDRSASSPRLWVGVGGIGPPTFTMSM
jgi:hypothetical protein